MTSLDEHVLDKSYWAAQLLRLFQLAQKFVFNSLASFSILSSVMKDTELEKLYN